MYTWCWMRLICHDVMHDAAESAVRSSVLLCYLIIILIFFFGDESNGCKTPAANVTCDVSHCTVVLPKRRELLT